MYLNLYNSIFYSRVGVEVERQIFGKKINNKKYIENFGYA